MLRNLKNEADETVDTGGWPACHKSRRAQNLKLYYFDIYRTKKIPVEKRMLINLLSSHLKYLDRTGLVAYEHIATIPEQRREHMIQASANKLNMTKS